MTSRAGIRLSSPSWGPVVTAPTASPGSPWRRAGAALAVAVARSAASARRAAVDVGPDAMAGVALLVGWTLLWVLFLVGILEPASAMRLVR